MPSIRDQLREYETSLGKRTGRLAVTIDHGQVSKLGFTAKGMKYYIQGLCIFLVVTSIIVLATGSYADANNQSVQALGSTFVNLIYMCGAFLLLMGVTGLCGAVRESRLFLFIFAFLVGCMFIILVILSAVLLSYIGQETTILNRFWQAASDSQREAIQNNFYCCGANSNPCIANDGTYRPSGTLTSCGSDGTAKCCLVAPIFDKSLNQTNAKNSVGVFQGQLPYIPCPPAGDGTILPTGCTPLLVNGLKEAATGFGVTGIFLGVFCLSGMLATCCLLSGIRATEEQAAALNKKSKAAGSKGSRV